MRARSQTASPDAEWESAWAEHDARQARLVVEPAAGVLSDLPSRPDPAVAGQRRGGGRWALGVALLLLPVLWSLEPIFTAWQVARALDGGDVRTLARHVDVVAVEAGMRERLTEMASRAPEGPGIAYLRGMADDIARASSSPAAIAGAARRGGEAPRLKSLGLTEFELVLGTAQAPMTMRFELSEGALLPRWQVTDIQVEAPPPPSSPQAIRLSSR